MTTQRFSPGPPTKTPPKFQPRQGSLWDSMAGGQDNAWKEAPNAMNTQPADTTGGAYAAVQSAWGGMPSGNTGQFTNFTNFDNSANTGQFGPRPTPITGPQTTWWDSADAAQPAAGGGQEADPWADFLSGGNAG